jgi:antitoxin MazE
MEAAVKIKAWGNGLGVRLTAQVARAAGLTAETLVNVTVENDRIVITPAALPKLTLAQKLAAFDPKKHSSEAMQSKPVGREVW